MDAESKKEEESSKKIIHTYPLIRMCDMADEMRGETMELCVTACEKHAANNELAARMIKENMDKRFGPSWHAVVGEGYGFEISYEWHFWKKVIARIQVPEYVPPILKMRGEILPQGHDYRNAESRDKQLTQKKITNSKICGDYGYGKPTTLTLTFVGYEKTFHSVLPSAITQAPMREGSYARRRRTGSLVRY